MNYTTEDITVHYIVPYFTRCSVDIIFQTGFESETIALCCARLSRNIAHDTHTHTHTRSQAHSQQRRLPQYDMLLQHRVNIRNLICKCF